VELATSFAELYDAREHLDRNVQYGIYKLDPKEIIEHEQAGGQRLGPFHTRYLLETAPHNIKQMLRLGRQKPLLIAGSGDFVNPLNQFPVASLRAAINTTTTETNLWDPNVFCFIGANTMRAGMRWVLHFGGVMGTTGTPTVVWTARFGTNNAVPPTGTTLGAGSTITVGTFTAQPFFGKGEVGVRSLGVAASTAAIAGTGMVAMPAAAAATVTPVAVFGGALPTTVDQTINQGISVSIIWGASSASNTLTPQFMDAFIAG
jgi:hypothetical protein